MRFVILTFIVMLLSSLSLFAQEKESKGKISGLVFGDYFYNIAHHNQELKDQRGFQFRRIYFTYDYTFDDQFSSRLRLEMSNEGDYTSSVAMVPFVKDAYLQYKMSNHALILGISQTPMLSTTEKVWGYRYIEKIPLDLYKFGSSRDFGLAAKGNLDQSKTFKYHAMLSNGSSNKQEIDKGKSALVSVAWFPAEEWVFEVFGEYADAEGANDAWTSRIFAAYTLKSMRIGLEYAAQTVQDSQNGDVDKGFLSGFYIQKLGEKFNLILRADRMLKPLPAGPKMPFTPIDPTAKFTNLIAAFEWQIIKGVSLTPTIQYVTYNQNDAGVTPGDDIYAKLTYYWLFD